MYLYTLLIDEDDFDTIDLNEPISNSPSLCLILINLIYNL